MKRVFWLGILIVVVIAAVTALGGRNNKVRTFVNEKVGIKAVLPLPEVNSKRITGQPAAEEVLAKLVEGNNQFACDLYRKLCLQRGNVVFSPYSISTALAMAYAGARGETEQQMAQVLHFELPQEELHAALNTLDLDLQKRTAKADFNIANALWAEKQDQFLPAFTNLLDHNYGAGLRQADFLHNAEQERKNINNWVARQTRGEIADLIASGGVKASTALVLVNAIYFKDDWEHPFHPIPRQSFLRFDNTYISAEMMAQTEKFRYTEGPGWQAVELPYKHADLAMVVILPEFKEFFNFEKTLDAGQVDTVVGNLEPARVELTMPKFRFKQATGLAKTLAEMGMPLVFKEPIEAKRTAADFSGMDGSKQLFISAVIHQALIDVDEKGTKAAGSTAIFGQPAAIAPQSDETIKMHVDHPFILLIRDTKTGAIIFMGRVMEPR
jgi:serpin B